MSEYLPATPAKVVIGVCGEQGSGKTVFLTCIFQSVANAFPDDLIIDFDRKDIGNANYFQSIEDSLIGTGPTQGTTDRSLFPVRIFVRPFGPPGVSAATKLTVDLLDFAGRHFRSMADLKDLHEESESDPDDIKALREVNETLEQADAFVILINSTEIDPLDPTPKRNPFSPSVNFMLAHCRAERKPVALLFSQIDQTPHLTEAVFCGMPRVEEFRRRFTEDLEASIQHDLPFGIARRISCYQTIPGDLAPRSQTSDGSIWCREPAKVVLELLRATIPRVNRRLESEAAEAEKKRVEDEATRFREGREERVKESSRRKRRWTLRIAALLVAAAVLAALGFTWYKRIQNDQAHLLRSVETSLREGTVRPLSPQNEERFNTLLAESRADPSRTAPEVRAAISALESALSEAAQRLSLQPRLESSYRDELAQLQSLVPRFDPMATAELQPRVLPLLAARETFLNDWFGTRRDGRGPRTAFLDTSARGFEAAGDGAFAALLQALSTKEKMSEIAGWQPRIDADADVASRLATLQSLLASAIADGDPGFGQLAREALARQLVTTILKRQENGLFREKVLTTLAPDLAKLEDGEVRFEVLSRDLLDCTDEGDCQRRQGILEAVATEAQAAADSWSAGVENLLRSLLLDLPPDPRRRVWIAMGESLSTSYLFNPRQDAWPNGVEPLIATFQGLSGEADTTEGLIDRMSHLPIYEQELRYLGDRLTAIVSSRRVVPIYSELLAALSEKGSLLQTEGLAVIGQQVSSRLAERAGNSGPLVDLGREIDQVLALAQSVNSARSRGGLGDVSAPVRLERLLRDAKLSYCTALEAHEAPLECAHAA